MTINKQIDIRYGFSYDLFPSSGLVGLNISFLSADDALYGNPENVYCIIDTVANHATNVFSSETDALAYFTSGTVTNSAYTSYNVATNIVAAVNSNLSGKITVSFRNFVSVGSTIIDFSQPKSTKLGEYAAATLTNGDMLYRDSSSGALGGTSLSDVAKGVLAAADFTAALTSATGMSMARTTSTESTSLVGTGATGTQVSSTKPSTVRFTVSTSTTANISTGSAGTSVVVLKKCSTNSATEGNWTTVATVESDQTIGLAIALNSIQVVKGQFSTDLPAGWYYKLVSSGSGTHTEAVISGEKTIYG